MKGEKSQFDVVREGEVVFSKQRAGRWHEWLNDYDEQVSDEEQEFELNDSYGKIWVFQE